LPGWQIVPATWRRQPPAPSHVPSKPHVDAAAATHAVASRGFVPATTKVHVPGDPAAAQVLHASVQAVLQQTPSTQKLLAQSDAHSQVCPADFFVAASPPLHAASTAGRSGAASRTSTPASCASKTIAASASGWWPGAVEWPPQPSSASGASAASVTASVESGARLRARPLAPTPFSPTVPIT
jgi:hypothetical protein